MKQITIIGIGSMGGAMAHRLLTKGYSLKLFDTDSKKLRSFSHLKKVKTFSSSREAAKDSKFILLSLPGPKEVKEIVLGKNGGILEVLAREAILINTSTVDPETSKLISSCTENTISGGRHFFLDAPISGGRARALDGTLTIIVGGKRAGYLKAKSLLETLGSNIYYAGPSGSASTIKLLNQILTFSNLYSALEVYFIGHMAGIKPSLFYNVIRHSTGNSFMLENLFPLMFKKRSYGGRTGLLLKDILLARSITKISENKTPSFDLMVKLAKRLNKGGYDKKDVLKDMPGFFSHEIG